MSTKSIKLTSALLRKIVQEEVKGFGEMDDVEDVAKDTEETDADEYADSLGKKIDYVKALKIEEARLTRRVMKIREARARVLKNIRNRKTV
jgi:hypothetical protein